MLALLLYFISITPPTYNCEIIELNHFYNEKCEISLDQLIFWGLDHGRPVVMDWRLLHIREYDKEEEKKWKRVSNYKFPGEFNYAHSTLPHRTTNGWIYFFETSDKIYIKVKAKKYIETFTQYDPERKNRKVLPQDERFNVETFYYEWSRNRLDNSRGNR